MGCLTRGGTEVVLACRSLVGRSRLAQLRLNEPTVSAEHAVIFWEHAVWRVRDLGSLNGTFVNGKRLSPRGAQPLAVADRLGFGEPQGHWRVASGAAPEPCADKQGEGVRCFGRGGLLLLPDESMPEASIYQSAGRWVIENGSAVAEIDNGDKVTLSSGVWHLLLPESEPGRNTESAPLRTADLSLLFRVSKNEEEVEVAVARDGFMRTLPRHACLYTLLTLARHRMAASHEHETWIHAEELARRLRCSREKLNVDIHRIRRLFQMAGVHDASEIIVRRNVHELRSGGASIVVDEL